MYMYKMDAVGHHSILYYMFVLYVVQVTAAEGGGPGVCDAVGARNSAQEQFFEIPELDPLSLELGSGPEPVWNRFWTLSWEAKALKYTACR